MVINMVDLMYYEMTIKQTKEGEMSLIFKNGLVEHRFVCTTYAFEQLYKKYKDGETQNVK